MTQIIKPPFGAISDDKVLTATGAQAIVIDNQFTVIDGVAVEATADRTLNLTIAATVEKGAQILVKSKTNGTEDTIFGTGITSLAITGAAGKIFTQKFTFDGTAFLPDGLEVQID